MNLRSPFPVTLVLSSLLACGEAPTAAPPSDAPIPETPTEAPAPVPMALPFPRDLQVSEIAVLQGVHITVARDGQRVAADRAPLVAGREALVRVYVRPDPGFAPRDIIAELQLGSEGAALSPRRVTRRVTDTSVDRDLASTFNFSIPADAMTAAARFSVELLDPAGAPVVRRGMGSPARYPQGTETELLGAQAGAEQLKVQLVPVRYAADGSSRLPDTSAAQVEVLRRMLLALYPVARVDISVHAPFSFAGVVKPSGEGFSALLQAILGLRQRDAVSPDIYYMGLVVPAPSEAEFCKGTTACVAGLSAPALDPRDVVLRGSVGLGYSGAGTALTVAHELGHAHGRRHAPCGGAAGADPAYPHAGGGIGVWGYSLPVKRLVDPAQGKDFMSYCGPAWISDYTYGALFARISGINLALNLVAPKRYRMVHSEDGQGEGVFHPYDHLPGGLLLIPE